MISHSYASFFTEKYNVPAQEVQGTRISHENELAEYFIQFRHDELLDVSRTLNVDVDINEHPLLTIILKETTIKGKILRVFEENIAESNLD